MTKPLVRSTSDKYIAGVCGGIAHYLGLDANLVRVAMVLLTIFAQPVGFFIYPTLWLLMPTDQGGPSGFASLQRLWTAQTNRR